ncbi:hypothetical protein BJX64DRAFT_135168 [Aspergillus heterothallicus]
MSLFIWSRYSLVWLVFDSHLHTHTHSHLVFILIVMFIHAGLVFKSCPHIWCSWKN